MYEKMNENISDKLSVNSRDNKKNIENTQT